MTSWANPTPGATAEDLEYEVKAAMIYNFTRFIEWPATVWKGSHDPMIIGVIGSDPLAGNLENAVQGKTHAGHDIRVNHIGSMEDIGKCQMLFVAKSEKKHLPEILRAASAGGVLTVSDIDGFVQAGGMIGLVLEDKRVHFEIAVATAKQAGLAVSSKLLSLAAGAGPN